MNWTEKYKPLKFTDLVYAEDIHLKCLKIFKKLDSNSILIITGPVGVGKSTLVRIMCTLFKYNIVESYSNSKTLDKKKNILVIEDVEMGFKVSKKGCPVVITSTFNINIPNAYILNIKKHDYDLVKSVIDKIYKEECLDFKNYSKLIPICNYDLRSVINNLQIQNTSLINKETANYYEIFSRHLKWGKFDKKSLNFVYSAYLSESSKDASDAFSICDILGEEYYYLPLSRVNQRRNWNVQIVKNTGVKRKVDPYFSLLDLKTKSEENIAHLQEIIKSKCVVFEDSVDIENIKKYKKGLVPLVVEKETGDFKFKFKKGVSKFSKRYLTVNEFLQL